MSIRVIALLAVYNEERFVATCIEHLSAQGVDVYVIDNDSTDRTSEIVQGYLGNGVVGVERFPRNGVYEWEPLLRRKETLATELDAEWFIHLDADELRCPPRPAMTLAEALAEVDEAGFNAVNFHEFTFVPTLEHPHHDHGQFAETMRWYYPFLPRDPDRLTAWKRQPKRVDLAGSGGHIVRFDGLRMAPRPFPMRHYLFLSAAHAEEKYVRRRYARAELARGWHRARSALAPEDIRLLPQDQLREVGPAGELDGSAPRKQHPLFSG